MVTLRTKKIISTLSLAIAIVFIMVLVSQIIGLGRTGFDSEKVLTQFFFYAGPGGVFLLGVLLVFFLELLRKDGDAMYGDTIMFNEGGVSPALPFRFLKSPLQILILSILVFSIFGLYVAVTQTTFTGVGQLRQQFTVLDSLIYSSSLVPAAENLGAAFLGAVTIVGIRAWARRKKFSRSSYIGITYFTIPIVFGLYGLFNHLLRYASSDIALFNVFLFWAIGGAMTVATGSFIPFWIAHISNNFFIDIQNSFSNDGIVVSVILLEIVLGLFYYFAFIYKRGNKHGN